MRSYNDRTSLNADQNLQYDLCSRLLRLVMTSRLHLTEAATQAPQPIQAAASKARSASALGTGITDASGAAPVFTETKPSLPCFTHNPNLQSQIESAAADAAFSFGRSPLRGSGCRVIARQFLWQE